ncbi:MAG TPA: hypothetical protein VLA06_09480 [Woeseiaceae bacterium]|jgi:hypothetical protein|nr:hypothetical protein [Woeseiaceae bacterium]
MTTDSDRRRIVIALTETSPVPRLWHAAMARHAESPADLLTLFLQDERWLRAASLPFTREFPRSGGRPTEFTHERAREVGQETARQAKRLIEQLADKAKTRVIFETVLQPDRGRLIELIGEYQSILIAHDAITALPIYVHLVELGCHIELIGSPADNDEEEHGSPEDD